MFLLFAALLLAGCAPKYQAASLGWSWRWTNATLTIFLPGGDLSTNVAGPDTAANLVGQYGWQLVAVTADSDGPPYYFQRRARAQGDFVLVPDLSYLTNELH